MTNRFQARNPQSLHARILDKLKKIESFSLQNPQLLSSRPSHLAQAYEMVIELESLLERRQGEESRNPAERYKEIAIGLTPKEEKLLSLFAKGFTYRESAEQLDCKLSTVQTHAKKIYKKLGVHSRSEAVYEAIGSGLIEP